MQMVKILADIKKFIMKFCPSCSFQSLECYIPRIKCQYVNKTAISGTKLDYSGFGSLLIVKKTLYMHSVITIITL